MVINSYNIFSFTIRTQPDLDSVLVADYFCIAGICLAEDNCYTAENVNAVTNAVGQLLNIPAFMQQINSTVENIINVTCNEPR